VNFTFRQSAAIEEARRLVADGRLGCIRHVEACHLQSWLSSSVWGDWRTNPAWLWRLSTTHGSSGVLGDLGGHVIDAVSHVVGSISSVSCRLKTFAKAPDNRIDDFVLDANDSAVVTVEFVDGALGTIHMSRWATGYVNRLSLAVHGEDGALRLDLEDGIDVLETCLDADIDSATWKTASPPPLPSIQHLFVTAIREGRTGRPDFARGAEIQRIIEGCKTAHESGRTVEL